MVKFLTEVTAVTTASTYTVDFRLLAPSKFGMQNCKVSRDLNPPIESKLSRDNLDSIGGFKSRDTFAVLHSEFLGQPT